MLKAFKYRLYPTEDQKILLNKHLGTTRFVYNLALETKICSACGEKYSGLRLGEREWTCEACGTIHDRDVNAAVNIKNWPVERRCQDVESGSVDERLVGTSPKKHPIGEALKVLEFAL